MKILNFGSCNIDIVYSLDHIVTVGETETGYRMAVFPGGKGLNQSIALARAGAKVYHAGCIGQDGEFLAELLDADGVDVSNIKRVDEKNGHAIIQVSAKGENAIFIYPGSNACMTPELIEQTLAHFDRGDLLLLQNEINAPDRIVRLAYEKGLSVVLNPSPCNEIVRSLDFDKIAYLILNEVEAEMLTGCREPMQSLRYFGERYPTLKVVLTLGEKGSIYYENGNEIYQPAFEAKAVDTTAAGDTFTGYFLAGIATHGDISRALRMASAAAAIAVSRPGAAPSVPMAEEVMTAVDHMHEILPEGDKIQQIKRKTEAYIAAHLSDADTNGLSKELGYSNAYTRNLISQIYGQSFSKLLQENRCRAAAELLADTGLSVHEIIERVGYENESFFRMLFKEKYGKNLLAYRHFMRGAKRTDGKNQLSKLAENE